jgi:VanZ family protein
MASLWPFNFLQPNQVEWEKAGGLSFSPPSTAFTVVAPSKLCGLKEWTVYTDIAAEPPLRSGRILGYGTDEQHLNLSIDQFYDDLVVRVRTSAMQRPRELAVEKLFSQDSARRLTIAVVRNDSDIVVFVNNERRTRQHIGTIDYDSWDQAAPIILGSHPDGKFGWKGIYHRVAVYGSALTPDELRRLGKQFDRRNAVLRYSFDESRGTMVNDRGAGPAASLIWLPTFSPYKPTVLQSLRDYWPDFRRPFIRDMLANIIMYAPLGFLIGALVTGRHTRLFSFLVPVMSAVLISSVLEICQSYLPSRNSSLMDVTMNGLGAALGTLAYRKRWLDTVFMKFSIGFKNMESTSRTPD